MRACKPFSPVGVAPLHRLGDGEVFGHRTIGPVALGDRRRIARMGMNGLVVISLITLQPRSRTIA
jgi:hypothetical protein